VENKLRILILEDVAEDAEMVIHELRNAGLTFSSKRVETKDDFTRDLDEFNPDIILADYKLPSFDGLTAFKIAKEKHPDVIFIFVTGEMGEEFAIGTLLMGATDYVLKSHLTKLAPAVRRAIEDSLVRSERRQAELALIESEERYRNVVETSPNAVFICSVGKCVFSNRSGVKLLGASSTDQLVGKAFSDFVHPESRGAVEQQINRIIEKGQEPPIIEDRFIRLDGTPVDVEVTGAPFTHNDTPAALVIAKDVTDRKRMEKELLKTHKLESVGLLAGGIAHDFNNLLTAILGNITLAKAYSDPEGKASDRLSEAERTLTLAKGLTQQLLTFAKGGAPVKETSYIRNLIKDSATFTLTGSNIKCNYSIATDLWPVDIDKGQLCQVINNLVLNARHAMPDGGTITLSAENIKVCNSKETVAEIALLEDGDYIKIAITDYGVGIDKQYLDKIFDPYFTTKQKGSGLGLATSYSIIKNHDGRITVESQPGVGTTFHIYLRASKKEATRDKARKKILTSPQREQYKGQKVLVMDDDENIRKILKDMLTYLGFEVHLAVAGLEAIELYRKEKEAGRPFGAVIMDLTIPGGMGGKEAIKGLLDLDPDVKAIVSSGYSNDPVMADFKKYGFREVLAKPYQVVDLNEKLHSMLTGEGA
jgi:PAS domain S-box-containing protein